MPIYDKYFLLTQDSPVFVTREKRQQAQREQAQRGKGSPTPSADIGGVYTQPAAAVSLSSATSPFGSRQAAVLQAAVGSSKGPANVSKGGTGIADVTRRRARIFMPGFKYSGGDK